MENKIEYKDKLEIDSFIQELKVYKSVFNYKDIYKADIAEVLNQTIDNFQTYQFSKALICYNKLHDYVAKLLRDDLYYQNETIELRDLIIKLKNLTDDFIKKGLDNYKEENIELSEKDRLKIQKQQADKRLKEIQEENAPYLNLSIGLSMVLTAIVFMCIPTFFNSVALYHICGSMLALGVLLLLNEINIRQSLGWSNYSNKITSKRAFSFLLQAFVYMIPLSVLFYFFSENLIIKILFFVQVWFCGILMINGISLLIVTNITKNKEKKFNIWNFILGTITIAAFMLQLLQIFKVL